MFSLFLLGFRLLSYSLFLWIILSWIQVSNDHPIGQVKMILDRFYGRLLEPIRSRIGPLRIGMAGIDLSPIILILGINFLQPIILRFVC